MVKKRHLLLFYIFLFVFASEIFLEYFDYIRGYKSIFFGDGKISKMNQVSTSAKAIENMNEWGKTSDPNFPFRSRKYLNSDLKKKIWILSSSMTEDIYVKPAEIWPNIMEEELNRIYSNKYQILNAAESGMDIQDSLNKLRELYRIYSPDVVVLYNMSNSIIRLSRRFLGRAKGQNVMENQSTHWSSRFIEKTAIYQKAKNIITTYIVSLKLLDNSIGEKGREAFLSSIKNVRFFCEKNNIELYICTFATEVGVHEDIKAINKAVRFCFKYNIFLSAKGWINTIQEWNDDVRLYCNENGIKLIDIDIEMTGRDELFRDLVHFTKKGHKRFAEIMVSKLSSSFNISEKK